MDIAKALQQMVAEGEGFIKAAISTFKRTPTPQKKERPTVRQNHSVGESKIRRKMAVRSRRINQPKKHPRRYSRTGKLKGHRHL